jgi:hypothetical protein
MTLNRRDFVKTGVAGLAGAAYGDLGIASAAQPQGHALTLENDQMVWEFAHGRKLASQGLRNKASGRYFPLRSAIELQLVLSAVKDRIDIPWWRCSFGPDKDTPAETEAGHKQGFAGAEFDDSGWQTCFNLGLRGVTSSAGLMMNQNRPPVVYQGYGWFRARVELPSTARDKEVVLNLGGYDETDWHEYWIYVNGANVGRRTAAGRWRSPGKFQISPGSPAYATLRFGSGSTNTVAVRTRSYDRRYGGLSDDILDRHMFDPVLHDQFLTVGEPYLIVDDFETVGASHRDGGANSSLSVKLTSPSSKIQAELHYELDGAIRRKWANIQNTSADPILLLDINLDTFKVDGVIADGGYGYPLTIDDQVFAAVEHPSGFNRWQDDTVQVTHFPGRWLKPGETWRSHNAIVGVGPERQANRQFLDYLEARGVRKNKILALYDPFGITAFTDGMSWALNNDQNSGTLDLLEKWQKRGVKFDYYIPDMSLDTTADLKRFRLFSFPEGPGEMVQHIRNLGMKFGQWFCVTAGSWSNGRNPKMAPSLMPSPVPSPFATFRNGYLAGMWGNVGSLCVASEPYFSTLHDAVLYHIQENHVELVKFDVGDYYCNSTQHGHLPGKYSTEESFNRLLAIARAARAANPAVFIHWYWGIYSPFIALDGDVIFDIRISMEAASTGDYPALFFRDAVTQALDQATQYARWVPPRNHDSLGVWLANNWWGNQMGTVRWQESLVMDLARGNLLFPQVWGDLNNFEDHDVDFLARIQQLVKTNEPVFLTRRYTIGDAWQDDIYGYSYFQGGHGFIFLNNVSFDSRPIKLKLGEQIGLRSGQGNLELQMHHPQQVALTKSGTRSFTAGDEIQIQLLPFEVAMIEVGPDAGAASNLPTRELMESTARYSYAPALREISGPEDLEIHFADAKMLEGRGYTRNFKAFEGTLPAYPEGRHHLALVCTFTRDGRKWRQSQMNELVQAIAKVGDTVVEFTTTPDFRQVSNNQWNSWIVFSTPLPASFAGRTIQFGVSTYLPDRVVTSAKFWVIKDWWKPRRKPLPNYWD